MPSNNREELIKELREAPYFLDSLQCVLVSELIIADRKKIVSPLKEYKGSDHFAYKFINQALELAGEQCP